MGRRPPMSALFTLHVAPPPLNNTVVSARWVGRCARPQPLVESARCFSEFTRNEQSPTVPGDVVLKPTFMTGYNSFSGNRQVNLNLRTSLSGCRYLESRWS